jgi:hypothetical protein
MKNQVLWILLFMDNLATLATEILGLKSTATRGIYLPFPH